MKELLVLTLLTQGGWCQYGLPRKSGANSLPLPSANDQANEIAPPGLLSTNRATSFWWAGANSPFRPGSQLPPCNPGQCANTGSGFHSPQSQHPGSYPSSQPHPQQPGSPPGSHPQQTGSSLSPGHPQRPGNFPAGQPQVNQPGQSFLGQSQPSSQLQQPAPLQPVNSNQLPQEESTSPGINIGANPFLSSALQRPVPSSSPCSTPGKFCAPADNCADSIPQETGKCAAGQVCCKTTKPAPINPGQQFQGGYNAPSQQPFNSNQGKQNFPLNTEIPKECAAALKCVDISYCTQDGVMSDTTVQLTREQIENRVPLSDCQNPETSVIGKCCRDPNYKDPWPAGMMMNKPGMFAGGSQFTNPTSLPGHTINKPLGAFNSQVTPFPPVKGIEPSHPQQSSTNPSQNEIKYPSPSLQFQPPFNSGQIPQQQSGSPGAVYPGQGPQTGSQTVGQTQQGLSTPSKPQQGTFAPGQPQSGIHTPGQSGFQSPNQPQSGFQTPKQPTPGFETPQPPHGYQPPSQPGFQQPNQPQPGFQQPIRPQPGFQPPSQPRPGQPQPGFQQPSQPQPGFQQPIRPQPGFQQPNQPQPGFQQPIRPQPGFQQPSQPRPGQPQPGFQQPSQPRPGQPQPAFQQPGQPQPGFQKPIEPQPGFQRPHQPQPGFQQQGSQPGFQQPGQYQPGFQTNNKPQTGIPSQPSTNFQSPGSQQPFPSFQPQVPGQVSQTGAHKKTCGTRKQPYSNNNDDSTNPGEFPWHVAILSAATRSILCSGSIVSDNAVLTSAHCLQGLEAKDIIVKAGPANSPAQIRTVAAIVNHPSYDSGSLVKDQAVLALSEPLNLEEAVDKICLPETDNNQQLQNSGRSCFITGFGRPAPQGLSPDLHKISVAAVPNDVCENSLKQTSLGKYFILNEGFSCAAPNAGGTFCTVDIGSGLVCDRGDGQYELVGVYSWDTSCQSTAPAVISNCDTPWINQVIGTPVNVLRENASQAKPETMRPEDIDTKPGFALGYGK